MQSRMLLQWPLVDVCLIVAISSSQPINTCNVDIAFTKMKAYFDSVAKATTILLLALIYHFNLFT
ncbi:hypothetical protein KIN20_031739 [Parelaphostrongylus tenuis]|uniref:Uncharacterized protein n=1 Tax=Parelaphostrongylus tenuis TaxID=148309 RepID=A0AAD5R5K0_PARTN|nr:hypothetical protein KIN20_031739 [Parelaphostrongylus tenuis]